MTDDISNMVRTYKSWQSASYEGRGRHIEFTLGKIYVERNPRTRMVIAKEADVFVHGVEDINPDTPQRLLWNDDGLDLGDGIHLLVSSNISNDGSPNRIKICHQAPRDYKYNRIS